MSAFRLLPLAILSVGLAGCNSRPSVSIYAGGSQATINRTISVARGATVLLGDYASINPDCTVVGEYSVRLSQAPAQGRFEAKAASIFAYFRPANPRSRCNTQRVPGTKVTYRARPGAAGQDSFSYDFFTSTGGVVHYNVTVNIL